MPETLVRVTLPEMGESVTEGSIVEWRVKPGQWVDKDATLVDVTTDKVDVEIPAPASGVVKTLAAEEGASIDVGGLLAEIDTAAAHPGAGSETAASAPAAVPRPSGTPRTGESATPEPPTPSSYGAAGSAASAGAPTSGGNGVGGGVASHRAQRLAERAHLDLNAINGSGPGGMILIEDVLRADAASAERKPPNGALPGGKTPGSPPVPADARTTVLKGPANALVGAMEQSLTIPTATSFRTLGVGALEAKRTELNAVLRSAGRSEKISFTHLIAFALVRAAHEQPAIVASFRRDGAAATRVEGGVHLGIAVDTQRKDGSRFLVVPVIKNAASLDFVAFRSAYEELIVKAREGKLAADDVSGASFTLTNPGGIGTSASVPRLMAGQGAIIAAGAIGYPPGFGGGNDQVLKQFGIEKTLTLTSTYDHRVVQGAQSGEFLKRVEDLLRGKDGFYDPVFAGFGLSAPPAERAEGSRDGAAAPGAATAVPAGGAAGAATANAAGAVATSSAQHIAPALPVEPHSDELLRAVAAGMSILSSYRRHGHLAATLDPLGTPPVGDPALDWHNYALTPAIMSAIPAAILRTKLPATTLTDLVGELRKTYGSTIAYEVEHIANIEQREWLRDYIESGSHVIKMTPQEARQVLERLTRVETFERYLRKTYIGHKTFSIEGLDMMVPMLEETITLLAQDGVKAAVLGMAHRGRLATITHVVNRPYEEVLAEFEAAELRGDDESASDVTGDVKYHHGASGTYETPTGAVSVALANNPSHLEAVDAVVEGRTRALQTDHGAPLPALQTGRAAPILIHGDAAFSAQGVVAEVLNLQALEGYATGGTLHIISNNQIGFTTDPRDGRSTRYASDLAKGFDVPIVHVNADDVEACIGAVHLAVDFRRRFGHDVIIDLIGYRRFGHNETDEPAYTQPDMYERIKSHPSVRELYAQKLIASGTISADEASTMQAEATARITEAHEFVKSAAWTGRIGPQPPKSEGTLAEIETKVDRAALLAWSEEFVAVPAGFTIHPKLLRQLERRRTTFVKDGEFDWGLGEELAFASLLAEGTPVRLTGQDTQRGTFSHRHLVFHDAKANATYAPLQHLAAARASMELYNSPLSEYACLGFEYGYAVETPQALVLWEAQFGDFNNGAQIVIDQFIAAGTAKWGETSRLVLLLPHGYEGAGPEHSSARIERFLQLSAEGNVQVANCSTAAQYFHLLRHQACQRRALPLVIFTPKSLLRTKAASGHIDELTTGTFQPIIDDPRVTCGDRQRGEAGHEGAARHARADGEPDSVDGERESAQGDHQEAGGRGMRAGTERASIERASIERVLLCSGKIYYDLIENDAYAKLTKTAIVRLELLSPLPLQALVATLEAYPKLKSVVWVQEEPKNMGARAHVRRRLIERLPHGIADVDYVGRPYRASPSEGYGGSHAIEQSRIVRAALDES